MRRWRPVRHIRGVTDRTRTIAALVLAALAGLAVALALGDGDGDGEPVPASTTADSRPTPAPNPEPERVPTGGKDRPDPDPDPRPDEVAEGPSGPAPASDPERAAAATMRAYVAALDAGNGARVCSLFAPGALDRLDFPRERGTCAASVEASLGYRDPRGLPVWRGSEVTEAISAEVDGAEARVVATIFTRYGGVREPSIEDDIAYMRADGPRWLIVKPTATIYRAVGIAEIPPSVIAPPG